MEGFHPGQYQIVTRVEGGASLSPGMEPGNQMGRTTTLSNSESYIARLLSPNDTDSRFHRHNNSFLYHLDGGSSF